MTLSLLYVSLEDPLCFEKHASLMKYSAWPCLFYLIAVLIRSW